MHKLIGFNKIQKQQHINNFNSNMEKLDTTGWTKEKKEAYEQYLAKVNLEVELKKVMDKILSEQKKK